MALPILESPKYSVQLPSTRKTIEYRPFLVKEEKILLIAQEGGTANEMISAMKDIVRACTFDKVDPDKLTSYDLEFLFLKLRAKSVGETSTVKIKCDKCDTYTPVEINLDDVELPVLHDNELNKIMLTDEVGLMLRHIRVKDLAKLTDPDVSKADIVIDTVIASIESIFDASGVYLTDSTPKDELVTFINSLNRSQMEKIEAYIAATPKIQISVNFDCVNKECNHTNETNLSGAQSFFE